jgi:hypothetical protein
MSLFFATNYSILFLIRERVKHDIIFKLLRLLYSLPNLIVCS